MSWPHPHGSHRGDRRSAARGAAGGRVRWRWRAPDGAPPQRPLVLDERIAVVTDRVLSILDADGELQQRIPLLDDMGLGMLASEGPVLIAGSRVQQIAWDGALLWQQDLGQPIVALQRALAGELVACTHARGYPPRGRLVAIDRDALRWSVDDHAIVGAVFDKPELACDDLGNLYTLIVGRLGDGVSGDDVLTGGCRGFDRDGRPLWGDPIAVGHPRSIRALESGVVVIGTHRAYAYDPAGALQWECELDDGAVHRLPELGLDLVRSCSRLPLPRVLDRRPTGGGGTILEGIHDADGTLYFTRVLFSPPRVDGLLALDAHGHLRWHLALPAIPYALPTPVIGPEQTVLLAHGDELIAVE